MKLLIHISGGNLAGVYADDPNLEVELFDTDNLNESGLSRSEIEMQFEEAKRNLKSIY